jgi:hypothetical protein
MELDELKYHLNKTVETDQLKSSAELYLILKRNATSVVRKLQRSLWIEVIANAIVLILFIWQALYNSLWSLRVYFGSFIVLSVAALLILTYLINKINRLNNTLLPVKQNLEQIYTIIHSYKVICFRLTMILVPFCLIFSLLLGYADAKYQAEIDYHFIIQKLGAKIWLLLGGLVIYILILGFCAYYFTKWWLNRLFGKYLLQLRELLNEFEDE